MGTGFSFQAFKSRSKLRVVLAVLLLLIWGTGFAAAYRFYFRESVIDTVRSNRASAHYLSKLISEHQRAALGVIQSYAQRPLLIDAARKKDLKGVVQHLKDVKDVSPEMDTVFIADTTGVLWANYPVNEEVHGKNFSHADWYREVVQERRPYISGLYKRIGGERDLAVSICAPILDEQGNVLGVLGTSQRTLFLAHLVHDPKMDPHTRITLVDEDGRMIFTDKFPYGSEIIRYKSFELLKEGFQKGVVDMEIKDPDEGGRTKYLSFAPIEELGWSVIVEHGRAEIFESQRSYFILIGAVCFLMCVAFVLGFCYFMNRYKHLTEVHFLSSRILSAHEEERKRIAGDLHDSLSSLLAHIRFRVEGAIKKIEGEGGPGVTEPLKGVLPMIEESVDECRRLQMDLRPPMLDDLGLLPTLSWFCRRFETTYSGIRVEQKIGVREDEVPDSLRTIIFRVAQEAMSNIARHSRASLVSLSLNGEGKNIELAIEDNGAGFDVKETLGLGRSKRGFGLESMRERVELSGGSFAVESARAKGTTIRASWPAASQPSQ